MTAADAERRVDGYAPIEDYAALGDGRTVALVALDGRIDWWPIPTLDAPPAVAALLDPQAGGYLELRPTAPFTVERHYVDGTNVLRTTFHTRDGTVQVTDALPVGVAGPLPWGELVRRVDGIDGEVEMCWEVQPGTRFGAAVPWTEQLDRAIGLHLGDQHLSVAAFDVGSPQVGPRAVTGTFRTGPGSRGLLAITATDDEPVFLPTRADFERHLDRTVARWQEWSADLAYQGEWQDPVVRSALALKLLIYSPSGAIAAAPTTSLPERIGGRKNYDYRYMWIRDAAYTVDALLSLGLQEEVQAAVSFLLDALGRTAPTMHVFYRLDGTVPGGQTELHAPGYRHSRPARSGNSAAGQLQLGTYGDLFDTLWLYVRAGHLVDPATGREIEALADACCDRWQSKDAGLWELSDTQHYTISKIGCWVALDRAVRLAERGAVATGHAGRWRAERDLIHAWVNENCWSARKNAYTFYAGTEDLDAAVLIAGHTGFDRGERLAGTVDAIRAELADGPLVYRYTGMQQEEGAFLACSFWLVHALAVLGRTDEARSMMTEAVALGNEVGLFSEQMDPASRAMLGNFPQGLSHLALIRAANALAAG